MSVTPYSWSSIHLHSEESSALSSLIPVQWGAHKNPDGLAETGMISSVLSSH